MIENFIVMFLLHTLLTSFWFMVSDNDIKMLVSIFWWYVLVAAIIPFSPELSYGGKVGALAATAFYIVVVGDIYIVNRRRKR